MTTLSPNGVPVVNKQSPQVGFNQQLVASPKDFMPDKFEFRPIWSNHARSLNCYDFGDVLKADPHLCRVLTIDRADMRWLSLKLTVRVAFSGFHPSFWVHIECVEAVDFIVRPANPCTLGGGPLIEFHEQHPLLEKVSQVVPNTDGMDVYDPPVKFGVLIMDQTCVIAGQFVLSLACENMTGLDEQQKQQREIELQRWRECMKPFHPTQWKRFRVRSS